MLSMSTCPYVLTVCVWCECALCSVCVCVSLQWRQSSLVYLCKCVHLCLYLNMVRSMGK